MGNIIAFLLLDKCGRRVPALWALFLMGFINVNVAIFVQNQNQYMILKAFYSTLEGLTFPAITILFIEIIPKKRRGGITAFFILFYVLGEILCLVMVYFITDNLKDVVDNYYTLQVYSAVLAFFSFFLLWLTLDESPRYNLIR